MQQPNPTLVEKYNSKQAVFNTILHSERLPTADLPLWSEAVKAINEYGYCGMDMDNMYKSHPIWPEYCHG